MYRNTGACLGGIWLPSPFTGQQSPLEHHLSAGRCLGVPRSALCLLTAPRSPTSFPGHLTMNLPPSLGFQQCWRAPSSAWFPSPVAEAVLDAPQQWPGQAAGLCAEAQVLLFGGGVRRFGSIKVNSQEKTFNHLPVPVGNEELKHNVVLPPPSPRLKAPHPSHARNESQRRGDGP